MDSKVNCRFCSYFEDRSDDPVNQPWLEGDEFAALASRGALVSGWSLVCPRAHSLNLADLYAADAFSDFVSAAVSAVERRFGPARVFEHGATYAGSLTGCGTDHAHLHVVPLSFSLVDEARRYGTRHQWIRCSARDVAQLSNGREYLFAADSWDGAATKGVLAIVSEPVSQFFRRAIADRLALAEFFDYRKYPMGDVALSTQRALSDDVNLGVEA